MNHSKFRLGLCGVGVALLLQACGSDSSSVDPAVTAPTDTTSPGATVGPTAPLACDAPTPGAAPLRRLSNFEYQNTLADLTGQAELAAKVSTQLVREPMSLGFRNSASALTVSSLVADQYVQVALDVAHELLDVPNWFPCELANLDRTCLQTFVEDFGARAYRRPLTREELVRFSNLYNQSVEQEGDYRKAIEWIVASMLSSSHFLFRVELNADPGVQSPPDYEMASRLSYLLWQTMPDAELFRAASAGELTTPAGIGTQVQRMFKDPKAFRVYEFFEQWLDLDELSSAARDAAIYPGFDDALRSRFAAEGRAFVYDLLANAGTLEDLFTAEYTFADAPLAAHYGLATTDTSGSFVKLPAPGRSGVLTQAGLFVHDHAASTSMVRRGLKVRTDLLCQIVPAPPADVDVSPPVLDGTFTQRERLEQHRTEASCNGCHTLMDPIGALFDNFDALGRARSVDEGGAPIQAGGDVLATSDLNGHYNDVREFGAALARSEEVRQCVVRQAFRFFYGRELTAADKCTKDQIMETFARRNYRLDDLILAMTEADQFRYRVAVAAEETP